MSDVSKSETHFGSEIREIGRYEPVHVRLVTIQTCYRLLRLGICHSYMIAPEFVLGPTSKSAADEPNIVHLVRD